MRTIYMDLRYAFGVSGKSGKFNGGSKACQRLAKVMGKYIGPEISFVILINKNMYEKVSILLNIECAEYNEIDNLHEIKGNTGDLLWIPLVNDCIEYAKELERFKKKNKGISIIIHIHDTRYKLLKYDKRDSFLSEGLRRSPLLYFIGRKIHAVQIESVMKRICKCSDQVFTASNYSLQCLNSMKEVKNINLYFQGVLTESKEERNDNFLLFVSAGRPEKNFYRTLEAFSDYSEKNSDNKVKFIVTGLNEWQITRIKASLKASVKDRVILRGYVDEDELNWLYATCRGLVFTSKYEGFGLPVLEALFHRKPCVVSRESSIPEVLGSIGIYVDPFSVESIEKGICKIMDDKYYEDKKIFINKKLEVVKRQIELDDDVLMYEIVNYRNEF